MARLTETDLNEIKKRLRKTTPSNWVSYIEGRDHFGGSNFIMTGVGGERGTTIDSSPDIELTGASHDDQDFIAHARQDIPALISEIERLWAEKNGR